MIPQPFPVVSPEGQQHEKKKLIRRTMKDRSQQIRHVVQWLFIALNGWLAIQFYFWVRYFERGGEAASMLAVQAGSTAGCRLPG